MCHSTPFSLQPSLAEQNKHQIFQSAAKDKANGKDGRRESRKICKFRSAMALSRCSPSPCRSSYFISCAKLVRYFEDEEAAAEAVCTSDKQCEMKNRAYHCASCKNVRSFPSASLFRFLAHSGRGCVCSICSITLFKFKQQRRQSNT